MAIVLNNVTSGYNIATMNANFQKIEDYINDKLLARADTGVAGEAMMSRSLDMNGNKILNVFTDVNDSGSLLTVGEADSRYYNVSGDTLQGPMDVNGQTITNVPTPIYDTSPTNKAYVDSADSALSSRITALSTLEMNNNLRSLRFPESVPEMYSVSGRRNSLQGYNSAGAPVPIFTVTETADLALKLASYEEDLGASLVGTEQGTTVQNLLRYTIPQAYGAVGDGVHDDTDALYAAFKSEYTDVFIPAGTYLITRKLKCALTKNLNVKCDKGVVFKLADNARCFMMVFVGNRENDFSWDGGEFDGNWDNQGEETLNTNGTFKDLSHGFVVSLFNNVRLNDMFVHSFRGHSMNHAGNKKLHASNLKFNSHIAQAFPQGGSRGDGITGCSEDVLIENVYGFTTDDMVAVFAGILWVEGGTEADSDQVTNLDYLQCRSVTVRNVNPWKKLSDLDGSTEVYTWNGVVVGGQGGVGVEKIHISDVKGYTQYTGVRVGASDPVGSEPATDYWNSMGSVFISDISIRVNGTSSNQHIYNPIRIGNLTAASTGTAHECVIKELTISNVQLFPSGNTRTLIGVGYTTIFNANFNNISVLGQVAEDTYNAIRFTGDRQIGRLSVDGVSHNPPTTSSDTVAQAQLMLSWENTYSSVAAKLYINGFPVRRNLGNTAYISNVLIGTGSVAPEVYGYSAILRTSSNFHVIPKVPGVHCTDRFLGRVRVSPESLWVFEEFSTAYDTTNFGKPSASSMPGYASITWLAGMFVRVNSSPFGSVEGWLYNSTGAWQMVGKAVTNNMVGIITASSAPTIIAPYNNITTAVYNDATWPETYGQVLMFSGHENARAGAFQTFTAINGNTYTRTWNTTSSAWNSWFRVPQVVGVPASATAAGVTGNIAISASYIYVCVAANTWVRAALTTW